MEHQCVGKGRAHTVLEITHLSTRPVSNNQVSFGYHVFRNKLLFLFFNETVRNQNGRGWIVDMVVPIEIDDVSSEQVLEEPV